MIAPLVCERCGGSGKCWNDPCFACDGEGMFYPDPLLKQKIAAVKASRPPEIAAIEDVRNKKRLGWYRERRRIWCKSCRVWVAMNVASRHMKRHLAGVI